MPVLLLLLFSSSATGFMAPVGQQLGARRSGVVVREGLSDIEAFRSQLERSVVLNTTNSPADGEVFAEELLLSGTRRRSLETEIRLVADLASEDPSDAILGLWRLWFMERGSKNDKRLREVDACIGDGRWDRAESLAGSLCYEHPEWAEPVNRLATLKYLQGKYEDSAELCETVIDLKPHHFGALSGIVMCHMKRGDLQQAHLWAQRQLPSDQNLRQKWADDRILLLEGKLFSSS